MSEMQTDEVQMLFAPRASAIGGARAGRSLSARAFVAHLDVQSLSVLLERLVGHGRSGFERDDDEVVEDLTRTLALLYGGRAGLFEVRGSALALAREVTDEVLRRVQSIGRSDAGGESDLSREGV